MTDLRSDPDILDHPAVARIPGDVGGGLLILCDHASNAVPPDYDRLGLPESELQRHIAYDIGAAEVTRQLAALTGAPAVLSTFSRLVIDPNRGPDDPTLVMKLSDGAIVAGNAGADDAEVERRLERFYRPYDRAVGAAIDAALASGRPPAILSIHSFTPAWKGVPRPWHVTVLWDADPRLPVPLLAALARPGDVVVGDNEPYDGALAGDTVNRHATRRGLANALIEVRQDLIADAAGATAWAHRLAAAWALVKDDPALRRIEHHPSRTTRRRGAR